MGDKIEFLEAIGQMITKALNKKAITRLKFIIFLIGIGFFIFAETQIFHELNDVLKVVLYLTLYGLAVFFGVDIFQAKEIATNVRDVLANNSLSMEEKIMQITNIVSKVLIILGEAWEIFDKQQFEKKEEPKVKYYASTSDPISLNMGTPTYRWPNNENTTATDPK